MEPSATGETADQPAQFVAPGTMDWPDQTGRAVLQSRPRANEQPRRTGVFTGNGAMLFRG